jgi:hypothetical protein
MTVPHEYLTESELALLPAINSELIKDIPLPTAEIEPIEVDDVDDSVHIISTIQQKEEL